MNFSLWSEKEGIPIGIWSSDLTSGQSEFELPFEVLGTWNNLKTFSEDAGASLSQISNKEIVVQWRQHRSHLRLFLVMSKKLSAIASPNEVLELCALFLDMMADLDEVENIELLKMEVKNVNPVIKHLLSTVQKNPLFGPLTVQPDIILVDNFSVVQTSLDLVLSGLGVQYGCLFWHGKQVAISSQWKLLTSLEQCLIAQILVSLSPALAKDIPLYMPSISKKTPYRLIALELLPNVFLAVICGAQSKLMDFASQVSTLWSPAAHTLRSSLTSHPRNIPSSLQLTEPGLLALLVIGQTREARGFSLVSLSPVVAVQSGDMNAVERESLLRKFYIYAKNQIFRQIEEDLIDNCSSNGICPIKVTDCSVSTSDYRLQALSQPPYLIHILVDRTVPGYSLKSLAATTLATILKHEYFSS